MDSNTFPWYDKKSTRSCSRKSNAVVFLDFSGHDFDDIAVITPSPLSNNLWKKCLEITLGSMSNLVVPKTTVFCESESSGGKRDNFDARIYEKIFSEKPDISFYSCGGGCTELEKDLPIFKFVQSLGSKVIKIMDRDDRSDSEIKALNKKGVKVLSQRHIESYLFDNEILEKLCRTKSEENIDDIICYVKYGLREAYNMMYSNDTT